MTTRLITGLALLTLIFTSWAASPPTASAEIEVRSQNVQNRFPQGLNFAIFLSSNADITAVRLRYRVLPEGALVTVRPTCTTGTVVNCNATVGQSQESYLAPGKEVQYFWEIEDASGGRHDTAQELATYTDSRFQWRAVTEGLVTANFYFGDDNTGQAVLRTAKETIDRFSLLENTRVDIPIKIWVYASTRDLADAAAGRRSDNVHLGQLAADDTVLVSRDVDFLNVVRHEVAHAVTARATRGFLAGIPIWINEGLSTYAQSRLLSGEETALDLAIRRNRVLPITGLTASARDASETVSLFYAQSWSIVKYLIDNGGPEKFAEFIAGMRTDTMDGALKKAYGYDQFGLEDRWRASVGLAPATGGGSGSIGGMNQPLPTFVPFGAGGQQSPVATPAPNQPSPDASASEEDGGGSSSLPVIIGAVVLVVALGAGGGYYVYRSKSKVAPPV